MRIGTSKLNALRLIQIHEHAKANYAKTKQENVLRHDFNLVRLRKANRIHKLKTWGVCVTFPSYNDDKP